MVVAAPPAVQVVEFTREDVHWPFRSYGSDLPYVMVGKTAQHRGWRIDVDPFPAYPHDAAVVRETAAQVAAAFPLRFPPTFYVLPHEEPARTNGSQFEDTDHSAEPDELGRRPLRCGITLPAKRIPIHPAMTRYVVAHEYGHSVEANLAWLKQEKGKPDLYAAEQRIQEEYAALRGMDPGTTQAGGTWHAAVQEVFACDFRILVCGVEPEYWPHPGIARPEEVPAIVEWWQRAREEVGG